MGVDWPPAGDNGSDSGALDQLLGLREVVQICEDSGRRPCRSEARLADAVGGMFIK